MAKKFKVLGFGLPTLAVAGAAVWYFFLRKKTSAVTTPYRPGVKPVTTPVKPMDGLSKNEIEVF